MKFQSRPFPRFANQILASTQNLSSYGNLNHCWKFIQDLEVDKSFRILNENFFLSKCSWKIYFWKKKLRNFNISKILLVDYIFAPFSSITNLGAYSRRTKVSQENLKFCSWPTFFPQKWDFCIWIILKIAKSEFMKLFCNFVFLGKFWLWFLCHWFWRKVKLAFPPLHFWNIEVAQLFFSKICFSSQSWGVVFFFWNFDAFMNF